MTNIHSGRAAWFLSVFFAFIILCQPSIAQADEAQELEAAEERIAKLEESNRILRAQLMLLQQEIKLLKEQLNGRDSSPTGDHIRSNTVTTDQPEPDNADGQSEGAYPDAQENPANVPDTALKHESDPQPPLRTYASLLEILRELPVELRPDARTGWDKYTLDELRVWLSENIHGTQFKTKLKIAHVTAKYMGRLNGDTQWNFYLQFEKRTFKFANNDFVEVVELVSMSETMPKFTTNEADFEKGKKLQVGDIVTVGGTINGMVSTYVTPEKKAYKIQLTNVVIESPKLK